MRLAAVPDMAKLVTFLLPSSCCSTSALSNPASLHVNLFAGCRKLGARDMRTIKPIDLMWYDVTGYEEGIEYQILDTSNETHIKVCAAQIISLHTLVAWAGHHLLICRWMPPQPFAWLLRFKRPQVLAPWLLCWQACKTALSHSLAAWCMLQYVGMAWSELTMASADV